MAYASSWMVTSLTISNRRVPFGVTTGEPVRLTGMFHPAGSTMTAAEAKRSRINAFGIQYEAKTGLSSAAFSWAA